MVSVPQQLIESLKGVPGFDKTAFKAAHEIGVPITSIRINERKWPAQNRASQSSFAIQEKIPWSQAGFYLAQRPSFTFDPLFHAGCYYVQEASSQFLEQALLQTTDTQTPLRVLDVCAAPGGKSTHLQSLLSSDSLLVSNDVIKPRAAVLKQNIIKWGCENVVVTNNDPQQLGRLNDFFDVIVVDAPCSGSGLFRKDEEAVDEWSVANVQLCCGRQKRILADVFPALKEGGVLIYSTCSYSCEENEAVADWVASALRLLNVPLTIKTDWNIVETSAPESGAKGYRFFPDKVKGEGFYLTVFRKGPAASAPRLRQAKLEKATAAERSVAQRWLQSDRFELFREPYLYGLSKNLVADYAVVKACLNVQYAGVAIGTVVRDKLVPEHALAVSQAVSALVPVVDVDFETAIRYLQRGEISLQAPPGWQRISYQGHALGWLNVLPNRINNYYPKELRILKQRFDSGFEK